MFINDNYTEEEAAEWKRQRDEERKKEIRESRKFWESVRAEEPDPLAEIKAERQKMYEKYPYLELVETRTFEGLTKALYRYTKLYKRLKSHYSKQEDIDADQTLRSLSKSIDYLNELLDKKLKDTLPIE